MDAPAVVDYPRVVIALSIDVLNGKLVETPILCVRNPMDYYHLAQYVLEADAYPDGTVKVYLETLH